MPQQPSSPERLHLYQNHHLDSTRWDYFAPRPGDIIISTSYKAGTTWMQTIIANLLHPNDNVPTPATALSPWLEVRFFPLGLLLNQLASQSSRRFIKTHLPLDGLPYFEDVQYVVVSRDPRDLFMSLLNHWGNHTPQAYMSMMFDGGAETFINKGTNGRWREVLTEADLALYQATMDRTLPPDCARWLEQGSAAV